MNIKELQVSEDISEHPAWYRLQNQRRWYSKESAKSNKLYLLIGW